MPSEDVLALPQVQGMVMAQERKAVAQGLGMVIAWLLRQAEQGGHHCPVVCAMSSDAAVVTRNFSAFWIWGPRVVFLCLVEFVLYLLTDGRVEAVPRCLARGQDIPRIDVAARQWLASANVWVQGASQIAFQDHQHTHWQQSTGRKGT